MSNTDSPILKVWQDVSVWLNAREYRDRVLVLAGVVVVLGLVWYWLVQAPAYAKQGKVRTDIGKVETEIAGLDTRKLTTMAQLARDPNVRVREQVKNLSGLSKNLDAQIEQLSASWITPSAMANALRRVLAERGNLKLVSLTSDTPKPLQASGPAGQAGSAVPGDTKTVYVHGMQVVLRGRYFDVLSYLEALEATSWNFEWDSLDYDVKEFPEATVKIRVQTYSADRAWIGV